MPEMAERIYEHYLQTGRAKGKKLTRKQFRKRYNSRLRRKANMATKDARRKVGSALTDKEFNRFR